MLIPRMTGALRLAIGNPVNGSNVTVTGTGAIASPYVINAIYGSNAHNIGELFGGGIVFWIDNTGQHGLIVSLFNTSQSSTWSTIYNVLIGPTAQSTWNGQANSTAMIYHPAAISSSAKLCNSYSNPNHGTGIYSDWYLPAVDELSLVYHARYLLNKVIAGESGVPFLSDVNYWSSTEFDAQNAKNYYFSNGEAGENSKNSTNVVRCVRDF